METRTRSVVKAVLWTVIGMLVMLLVGFFMTGSLALGGTMAVINSALGLLTYLIYERIWARISWGRRAPDHWAGQPHV
ncbi:DUF2061 domain-containing protein [Roseisalinus antarcticus]|uniref:DUF2061 domain-containing protein n=1 Tax=Roseisalinus antarcticus TaxID=254357 RepID=A0A1Y5RY69_9RHOB|nr:DUF2061 domain-containing protein [Roseisalinus antarcticus]SLN28312.1 hypothetical protein ROA7023_00951 [Roseisalinus antarcticus]